MTKSIQIITTKGLEFANKNNPLLYLKEPLDDIPAWSRIIWVGGFSPTIENINRLINNVNLNLNALRYMGIKYKFAGKFWCLLDVNLSERDALYLLNHIKHSIENSGPLFQKKLMAVSEKRLRAAAFMGDI